MEWTPEEKELFQELREFPKLHVPDTARGKMNELMKRQAAVDRKRKRMKLATGGVAGVAAAIALMIGIMNYDQIKSKFGSQVAEPGKHSSVAPTPNTDSPKYSVSTQQLSEALPGIGDRKDEFAKILKHSYDVIVEQQAKGKEGSFNAAQELRSDMQAISKLFPETIGQNMYIWAQGTNKELGLPYKQFDEEAYKKLKALNTVPLINELVLDTYGNAVVYLERGDLDNQRVQKAKEIFNRYYRYLNDGK
ncbi:hypothetical protein [Effusibacillus lacus]|uniref:Uncharacterized protein n=1 Tax=Effusibacillus lacus TaxID=1348429 RepID=A0A292YK68_9BACL|nr:hypothetical protein [Effusibacillus lacus]TCS74317.1 hypothetical protein EDD64_11457 [Effusibacillus lacus]GAX88774.1 hypothetical protein EFBL_0388 [Effusibacillus lacus]